MNVFILEPPTGEPGVLRECLLDPDVSGCACRQDGRAIRHRRGYHKLKEVVHANPWNYSAVEAELTRFDACFFCLGVSSLGMAEADYDRVTYGITMAAAETLSRLSPLICGLKFRI